jgi:hypothetical protein
MKTGPRDFVCTTEGRSRFGGGCLLWDGGGDRTERSIWICKQCRVLRRRLRPVAKSPDDIHHCATANCRVIYFILDLLTSSHLFDVFAFFRVRLVVQVLHSKIPSPTLRIGLRSFQT